jgi:hypothetical protein
MNHQKKCRLFRTITLFFTFMMYYGFIAMICWILLSQNPFDAAAQIAKLKGFPFLFCTGFGAALVLFISGVLRFLGQGLQQYSQGTLGLLFVGIDLLMNAALALFPILLLRHGALLVECLTPALFVLCVLMFLIMSTARRFKGFADLGLPACAK